MGTAGSLLTPEGTGAIVGAAVAGLATIGFVIRAFVKGWLEAKTQAAQVGTNAAAMVSAVSIGWERDQRERLMQTMERIAVALEQLVAQQRDEHERTMEDKMDELLKRLDK